MENETNLTSDLEPAGIGFFPPESLLYHAARLAFKQQEYNPLTEVAEIAAAMAGSA
jgi:hypothetical protein